MDKKGTEVSTRSTSETPTSSPIGVPAEVKHYVDRTILKAVVGLIAVLGGLGIAFLNYYLGNRLDDAANALASARADVAQIGSAAMKAKQQIAEANPSGPMIALLTDFGADAYYVGRLRGSIAAGAPRSRIVDISHEVTTFDSGEASWILANAVREFPDGSIALAIVNPGADLRNACLAETKRPHLFLIGANRSVLEHAAMEFGLERWFPIKIGRATDDSFGTRDLVPVAVRLLSGQSTQELGTAGLLGEEKSSESFGQTVPCAKDRPTKSPDSVRALVCGIDRWGNLQTNIRESDLPEGLEYMVANCGMQVNVDAGTPQLVDVIRGASYAAGDRRGGVLVVQDGFLQVAVYRGSAARALGVGASQTCIDLKRMR